MRVMDGDLVILTCLRMPTLILPTGHFVQMYYNPRRPGTVCTSHFPIWRPRLPAASGRHPGHPSSPGTSERFLPMCEKSSIYTSTGRSLRQGQDLEEDECMSTDTEAANTVRRLQLHCPTAMVSLQVAVHEALTYQPQPPDDRSKSTHYDSNDSVLDLDEGIPRVSRMGCAVAGCLHWGTASTPLWRPSIFSRPEQSYFDKLPDLQDLLNQAREARVLGHIPVQSVAPMPLPFASLRDLDRQRQQRHDQTCW